MFRNLAAGRARRRRVRELNQLMSKLDPLDAHYGVGALPRPRTPRSKGTAPAAVLATLLLAVVSLHPGSTAGAPAGYEQMASTAMSRTAEAPGFRFEYVGETGRRDFDLGTRLGLGGVPPVLVAWATEDEYPGLAGDVAGVGGSVPRQSNTSRAHYVTGMVLLDADRFDAYADRPGGPAAAQAIVDHEFGHLVGLAHVDDPGELMYDDNVGQTTYGPGDREGLARLGSVPCH